MINSNNLFYLTIIWISIAVLIFPVLLFVKQPYGRHFRKGWGQTITNRFGWIAMEMPSLFLFSYYFLVINKYSGIAILLFALWFIHYFNRTLVYPFRIKTKGKKMPLIIVVFGIMFNAVNASLNGIELNNVSEIHVLTASDFLRIGCGLLLFGFGMIINLWSDNILISLRKSSTNGYKIPWNGLFRYISCPNYFGEIFEWIGFAVIAWNLAAWSFAIWTVVNLVPRAIDHHKWYHSYFPDYPSDRKAIFPFLL